MAKKHKAAKFKCPETIYAFMEENDGDQPYLRASDDPSDLIDMEGEGVVGVYRLEKFVTIKNTTTVEED